MRRFADYRVLFALFLFSVLGGLLALIGFVSFGATTAIPHTATVGNATPSVTALTLNNASSIILTANTTTQVTVSFTVSDDNGCGTVFTSGSVTTTLYREGVSTTCAVAYPALSNRNYLNCYVVSTTTHNCVSTSTSAQATTTFNIWYFAEATDASSTYPGETWQAYVSATDNSSTYSTTTVTGQELLSLLGLNVETSSLNYGTVNPGTDTTSTNQTAQVKNAGNSSTTLRLNGTAMTSGGNSIATTSQHYSTSTFTYNTNDNQLQETATDVGGFSVPRPPLARWIETTAYPVSVAVQPVVANNNFLYVLGGHVGSSTSTVRYAPIGVTGTLGAWVTTTALPTGTRGQPAVANNGFMYVFGGFDGVDRTSTVLYASIGSTGTLGGWATTAALPSILDSAPAVVNGNYVYVIGGNDTVSGRTSTVFYAAFGTTGTIGAWATTTLYPIAIRFHPAATNNGYLYVVGGDTAASFTSTVRYAPIGSTGTIGTWATTTPLPTGSRDHTVAVRNGLIYAFGGDGNAYTSTVLYAPIGSTGTIGAWSPTAQLPTATATHGSAESNGIVYVVGGWNGSSRTSTVLMASLASRNTYWGHAVPAGTPAGTYNAVNTFTAVFQP